MGTIYQIAGTGLHLIRPGRAGKYPWISSAAPGVTDALTGGYTGDACEEITLATRRKVLAGASAAGALLALRGVLGGTAEPGARVPVGGFGPLQLDPDRILDLAEGFSYRVISKAGAIMSDGLRVPASHDGMAAFDAGDGRIALVCNHELRMEDSDLGPFLPGGKRIAANRIYDPGRGEPCPGGTTTIIYDPRSRRSERQFLSLAGTERNCAGGATPWGSWLSCEESVTGPDAKRARAHGWVFEVPASATGPVDPVPLTALGRFNHEAVAIDPRTGIAYLTEDRPDSLLYRFLPNERGRFAAGGRLQALALPGWPGGDTRNFPSEGAGAFPAGSVFRARWFDLSGTDSPKDDLRQRGFAAGAALFARGEGICMGRADLYFCCTAGGKIGAGQIFRYRPGHEEGTAAEKDAPGQLELFVESTDRSLLDNCDNLIMSPWGDLLVCEDAKAPCALVGITPGAGLYKFAENAYTDSELAGVCFAPDGRTLFVNVWDPGMTLAITGPFPA